MVTSISSSEGPGSPEGFVFARRHSFHRAPPLRRFPSLSRAVLIKTASASPGGLTDSAVLSASGRRLPPPLPAAVALFAPREIWVQPTYPAELWGRLGRAEMDVGGRLEM